MDRRTDEEMIRAYLLHLGCNMWADRILPGREDEYICFQPFLRCETDLWNEVIAQMAKAELNMAANHVGDGGKHQKHPQVPLRRARGTKRL